MESCLIAESKPEVQAKTKACFKCGEVKPLSEFYKHSKMGDGHLNKCKLCTRKDTSTNYRNNIEHYQKYEQGRARLPHRVSARAEYQKTEQGKEAHSRATKKYRERHPEKRAAHDVFGNALRDGKIQKQPCFICGSVENIHGHHYDYSKPLSVIWVCEEHHLWMHGKVKIQTAA